MLALVGLIGAGVTYWKSDRKADLLILYAFAAAVIILADWIAYGVLQMYDYYPGLAADHTVDSALGELLAELIFVPCFVVTLVPQVSGLAGMIIGSAVVAALEIAMKAMGIYDGSTWIVEMTAAGFAVYFAALDLLWHDLEHETLSGPAVTSILRGALVFDLMALLSLLLRAMQWVITYIDVAPTRMGNNALGRLIAYGIVAASLGYWALSGNGPGRWLRLCVVMGVLFVFNVMMAALGLHIMRPPWSITADTLAQGAAIGLALLADDAVMGLRARCCRRTT
ncbi:MAG: hypothetical protein K0R39_4827 [Symbiobacteriaceae bacterium]|nr:hypothetical protein [Symbiobacteriaceae bacterium]